MEKKYSRIFGEKIMMVNYKNDNKSYNIQSIAVIVFLGKILLNTLNYSAGAPNIPN